GWTAHTRSARRASLSHRRCHAEEDLPGRRRGPLPRRGVDRRALPDRGLRRRGERARPAAGSLSLLPGRFHAPATARRRRAPRLGTIDEIRHDVMPLSSAEVDYPELREMQSASSLATPVDVSAWRKAVPPGRRRSPSGSMSLPAAIGDAGRGLGDTIQHRGSSRRFPHAPLTVIEPATMLWWSTRAVAADVPSGLVDVFLVVNAVH